MAGAPIPQDPSPPSPKVSPGHIVRRNRVRRDARARFSSKGGHCVSRQGARFEPPGVEMEDKNDKAAKAKAMDKAKEKEKKKKRLRRTRSEPPPERSLAVEGVVADRRGFDLLKQGISSTPGILRWMVKYSPEASECSLWMRTTLRHDERVMGILENFVGGPNDLHPSEDPERVRKRIENWLDAY